MMIMLDPGHGGIDEKGMYTSLYDHEEPYKMYRHEWGPFYEGEFNRKVCNKCVEICKGLQIPFVVIPDQVMDTNLYTRVNMANTYYSLFKDAVYISIHANSAPKSAVGFARGYEIYHYPGSMASNLLAMKVADNIYNNVNNIPYKYRKKFSLLPRNPVIKEKDSFYVLKETKCPAILVECGFFDHPEEAKVLLSSDTQWILANSIIQGYLEYQKIVKHA